MIWSITTINSEMILSMRYMNWRCNRLAQSPRSSRSCVESSATVSGSGDHYFILTEDVRYLCRNVDHAESRVKYDAVLSAFGVRSLQDMLPAWCLPDPVKKEYCTWLDGILPALHKLIGLRLEPVYLKFKLGDIHMERMDWEPRTRTYLAPCDIEQLLSVVEEPQMLRVGNVFSVANFNNSVDATSERNGLRGPSLHQPKYPDHGGPGFVNQHGLPVEEFEVDAERQSQSASPRLQHFKRRFFPTAKSSCTRRWY